MIDEEFYENLSNDLYNEFQSTESYSMELITEQIGKVKAADAVQLIKLASKAAKALIVKQILDKVNKSVAKTNNIVYNSLKRGALAEYNDMRQTFDKLPVFDRQKAINDILERVANETGDQIRNYSGTTGFVNSRNIWQPLHKFYSDSIDEAIKAVRLGEETYYQTTKKMIRNMSDSGLSFGTNKDGSAIVEYPTKYHRRLDSAIRTAFSSGQNKLSAEQTSIMMDELGTNIVEVSAHSSARPDHQVWQGKLYEWKK